MSQEHPSSAHSAHPHVTADEYKDAVARETRFQGVLEQPVRLTWVLIVVNVGIWLVAKIWGTGFMGLKTPYMNGEQVALYTGMKVNALVAAGQWWRLISNQFVHLDIMHIGFNAYGLYVIGPLVERFYGWRRTLLLYVVTGTIGSVASFYFITAPSGGASGAIYGLVGVLLVFGLKYRNELPKRVSRALTTGMLPWVAFSLGIGFLNSLPMDNAAHLGGLFSGAILALVARSQLREQTKGVIDKLVWIGVAVALAALAWTAVDWGHEVVRCDGGPQAYYQCYPDLRAQLQPGSRP